MGQRSPDNSLPRYLNNVLREQKPRSPVDHLFAPLPLLEQQSAPGESEAWIFVPFATAHSHSARWQVPKKMIPHARVDHNHIMDHLLPRSCDPTLRPYRESP